MFPLAKAGEQSDNTNIPTLQVTIKSGLNMLQFRDLSANTLNKLVRVPGIVISTSVLSSRATKLHLQCRACHSTKIIYPQSGLGGLGGGGDRGLPRRCEEPEREGQPKDCPLDPYLIVHTKSTFSDHQTLKLQEAPDMVPVGELPRHILLSADRYLTGKVVPGSRVIATGIFSTFEATKNVRGGLHMSLSYIYLGFIYRKRHLGLTPSVTPTSKSSTLNYLHRQPPHKAAQIPSVYNFLRKRRKNLVRWPAVKDFMNVLQRVLHPASMVA